MNRTFRSQKLGIIERNKYQILNLYQTITAKYGGYRKYEIENKPS